MFNNKRIIVSMTSWEKRIDNVSHVVYSLLNQTIKPDSIEINLSIKEFSNKEKDLPNDLVILENNGLVNFNWIENNTGVFKKIIPVLQKYEGEDYYLFSVDDDWLYGETYIEMMLNELGDNEVYCPCQTLIGNKIVYKSTIFNQDFWNNLTEEIIKTGVDDTYITYYLISKRIKPKFINNVSIKKLMKHYNEISPLHDYYREHNRIQLAEFLSKQIWL